MKMSDLTEYIASEPQGCSIVLDSQLPPRENTYSDTALPFEDSSYKPAQEKTPERIRSMKRLYTYGYETDRLKAENFYKQALYMADYEDDFPWKGEFVCYTPTYHDMTTEQLRGYFSWRTRIRKGNYQRIGFSAVFIYLYELLNGIGADSPEDVLKKLSEFGQNYPGSDTENKVLKYYLKTWSFEYAVVNGFPAEYVRELADPELIKKDRAAAVLKEPDKHTDDEVFDALCVFCTKKSEETPVVTRDPVRGKSLFAKAWRSALKYKRNGIGLFELCFRRLRSKSWSPFYNAVVYKIPAPKDYSCFIDDVRCCSCHNGRWTETAYNFEIFDKALFRGFFHETDARLRQYLKTGRALTEKPSDKWADPFIDAAIEEDKKALLEARRQKISIDLSGLDRIRLDADATCESLLTDEEREEAVAAAVPEAQKEPLPEVPVLSEVWVRIIRALLGGSDASEILKAEHIMPSIAADSINEALFDEFGDTVIMCENDRLSLTEDYIDDIEQMLGGNNNG